MQSFYTALENLGVDVNDITNIITPAFRNNGVMPRHLSTLTNDDLRDYGIVQGGLRKDILKVVGKE
jgi:antitoxin component of RelBE/YafQ-DinJ toxin-antitoxin module